MKFNKFINEQIDLFDLNFDRKNQEDVDVLVYRDLKYKELDENPKICSFCSSYKGNNYEGKCDSYNVIEVLKKNGVIISKIKNVGTSPISTCKFWDSI
jgi:hypothetical protein